MKPVERYRWMIWNAVKGKRTATSWRMTLEDALATDPGATPVPGSLEVLMLPESPAEFQHTSDWQKPRTSRAPPGKRAEQTS